MSIKKNSLQFLGLLLVIGPSALGLNIRYDIEDLKDHKGANDKVIFEIVSLDALGKSKEGNQWPLDAEHQNLYVAIIPMLRNLQTLARQQQFPGTLFMRVTANNKTVPCTNHTVESNTTKVYFVSADRRDITIHRNIKNNTLSCTALEPNVGNW